MGESLRINRILSPVTALGPGRRIGIWLQGCSIHCAGCVSLDTWDPAAGQAASPLAVADECVQLLEGMPGLTGVTISGGEPLDQSDALLLTLRLLRARIADRDPAVDVLVYTGYPWRTIKARHGGLLGHVDAVAAGPFVSRRAPGGPWLGSANQSMRLITPLAQQRYRGAPDASADHRPFQVVVQDGRMWTVGIPGPGDLDRLEAAAAARGVTLGERSWRT